MAARHTHRFVEEHADAVVYGMDRENDEAAVAVYLQKLSDDALLETLLPRLSRVELDALFDMMSALLRAHLSEPEYHELFLKSE